MRVPPLALVAAVLVAGCSALSGLDDYEVAPSSGQGATPTAGGGGPGSGGVGSAGAGGAAGGAGPDLVNNGLVVRYFIGEPDGAATLADAGPNGLPLTVLPNANMTWTESATGRGLHWNTPGGDGVVSRPMQGTPLISLDGATAGTFEVVAGPLTGDSSGARIVHMGNDASNFSFLLDPDLELRMENSGRADWAATHLATRVVLHLVVDLTQASNEDKMSLFVDGSEVSPLNVSAPPATITLASSADLVIGNRGSGARSPSGDIHYVALYDRALSQAEIQQNAAALLVSDDP